MDNDNVNNTRVLWFSCDYDNIKRAVDGASVCVKKVKCFRPILQCVCIETKGNKEVSLTSTDSSILIETKIFEPIVFANAKITIKCEELKSALAFLKPTTKEPMEIRFTYDLSKKAVTLETKEKSASVYIYDDSAYPLTSLILNNGYEATPLTIDIDAMERLLNAIKKNGCDYVNIYVNNEPMKPSVIESSNNKGVEVNAIIAPLRSVNELRHSNITIKS